MLKNKTIKLFLILGVIFISLIGISGCTTPTSITSTTSTSITSTTPTSITSTTPTSITSTTSTSITSTTSIGNNSINVTYIRTHFFEDEDVDGQYKVINNHNDLVTLLQNDTPDKYNEDFFETKSLLVFKIVESSGGNKSEIESYEIKYKKLSVYVKTKQYGATCDMGYWWFILELAKEEVVNLKNIKIFKNGEVIMNNPNGIKSHYIKLDEAIHEDDLTIVDTQEQLSNYLSLKNINSDVLNKYDDIYFMTKSLIIFTNYEGSSHNDSIISSYNIENNSIIINVDTIEESDNFMMSYGYFILEVKKDEIKNVEEAIIIKNGRQLQLGL